MQYPKISACIFFNFAKNESSELILRKEFLYFYDKTIFQIRLLHILRLFIHFRQYGADLCRKRAELVLQTGKRLQASVRRPESGVYGRGKRIFHWQKPR